MRSAQAQLHRSHVGAASPDHSGVATLLEGGREEARGGEFWVI